MANVFLWDSRIKALYRFESSALIVDSIGNNTLTNNNGVAEDTVNYMEGACSAFFSQSGNTYFSIDDSLLDSGFPCKGGETNRSFTICIRVKPNSIAEKESFYIVSKTSGGGDTYQKCFRMFISNADSKVGMALCRNGTATYSFFRHLTALVCDGSNEYFIAFVHDATDGFIRIRILNNSTGIEIGADLTDTFSYTLNIGDSDFLIGKAAISVFDGNQDELVICNAALSNNETDMIWAGTYANPAPAKTMVLYDNLITASTMITASSEATNYEKEFLVDSAHSTCWRSTGVSSESLLINFGEAQAIDTIALGNHNLHNELTKFELQYGTTNSCTDGYVNLLDDLTETDFIKFFHSISKQYWKLVKEGATNITYYAIGELWLGVHVELDKNPLAQIEPFDKEHVAQEQGLDAYDLYSYIDWPLKWGNYNNADNHTKLLALYNTVKLAKPFWIMLKPQSDSVAQHVKIREFNFNQYLGVCYPGVMRVVSSL